MSYTPVCSFLTRKIAIITGGSGTIGKAIAKRLLDHPVKKVILTGRSLEKLEKAKKILLSTVSAKSTTSSSALNDVIDVIPCDVTNENSVIDFFSYVEKEYGGCDLLVNSAGIAIPGAITELSAENFDWVMKVNVTGPFLCSREAFKKMSLKAPWDDDRTYRGGRIINVGSISAISPRPDSAPYTASKFALLGLTQSLQLDGRSKGISVGIIHPGNVRSSLLSQEEMDRREALEGFVEPEDIAECVCAMANLPLSTSVLELTVTPLQQPLVGRG